MKITLIVFSFIYTYDCSEYNEYIRKYKETEINSPVLNAVDAFFFFIKYLFTFILTTVINILITFEQVNKIK